MTAQDLVNESLLLLGEIQPGESPSAAESARALLNLNFILSSWSLEGITVYTHAVGNFTLTANQEGYTMGPGGNWNVASRPVKIKGAKVTYQGLSRGLAVMPIGVFEQSLRHDEPIAAIQYLPNGAPVSAVLAAWAAGALPTKLGEDSAAPLKNVRVYPVQTVGATIELSYWTALAAIAALADGVSFPVPGYEAGLTHELAVVLAPSYGRQVSQELSTNMQRFKARINDINGQIELGPPPAPAPQQ